MQSGTEPLAVVASTDEVLAHPEAGPQLLNETERARAARFRQDEVRRDFVAAHLLIRLCAGRLLGVRPDQLDFTQYCPDCRQYGHGRPQLADRPDVHLTMSHAKGVVAVAAGFGPVGIDVELRSHQGARQEVGEAVLTKAEQRLVAAHPEPASAFLRLWCRKESLIKIGRARLDTLAQLDLSALPLTAAEAPGHRYRDLYVRDWTHEPSDALVALVSTEPARALALPDLAAGLV